ncbi:MAG: GPI anchored serine-threonine rich family protein, partial [Candidatus Omnitrophica bacterium]|nr:GPI anchored serine-threonine rich family protein [Candidatus Omnitrophota bacterium]
MKTYNNFLKMKEKNLNLQKRLLKNLGVFIGAILLTGGVYLLSSMVYLVPEAEAVQVKKVYKGTATLAPTGSAGTSFVRVVWIDDGTDGYTGSPDAHTPVSDVTKCVAFATLDSNDSTAGYQAGNLIYVDFYDAYRLELGAQEEYSTRNINWRIVEFTDGVFVQRGVTILAEDKQDRYTILPFQVDMNKSFLLLSPNAYIVTNVPDVFPLGEFIEGEAAPGPISYCNSGAVSYVGTTLSSYRLAQQFKYDSTGATYQLDKVSLYIDRNAISPAPQYVDFSIRETENGTIVTDSSVTNIDATTLPGSWGWFDIEFSTPVTLNDNQTYYIDLRDTPGGNTASDVNIRRMTGNPYPDGICYWNGTAESDRDIYFEVYEYIPPVAGGGVSKTLYFKRGTGIGARACNIMWQVVSFETDAKVQHHSSYATMAVAVSSTTAEIPEEVDVDKSFLVFSYLNAITATYWDDTFTRGVITNPTTLTFDRVGTAGNMEIAWSVVEFTDESTLIQQYSQSIAAAANAQNQVLDYTIDDTRSFITYSVSGGSTTRSATTGSEWIRADLSGGPPATTLTLNRVDTYVAINISNYVVELAPLTVKVPNGGLPPDYTEEKEVWSVGQLKDIVWVYADSTNSGGTGYSNQHKVKIELSVNGGSGYIGTAIYETPASPVEEDTHCPTGFYGWDIPADISGTNLIGEQLRVKITDTDMSARNIDISNEDFIIKGVLTIDQPPNTWRIGEQQDITWDYLGHLDTLSTTTVTIKLSIDGGQTYLSTPLSTTTSVGTGAGDGGSGTFPWTIPAAIDGENLIGTNCVIKITSNYDPDSPNTTVQTISQPFTLRGRITSVTPTSPTTWYLGEQDKTISWMKHGHFGTGITDGTVNIFYSNNDGLSYNTPIKLDEPAGASGTGSSYDWDIPFSLVQPAQDDYAKIKVVQSDIADSTVYGESASITIEQGSITLVEPMGGDERWITGSTTGDNGHIVWSNTSNLSTTNVKLYVSRNSGVAWEYIDEVAANLNYNTTYTNQSYYQWTPELPISDEAMVKIESSQAELTGVEDESDLVFDIDATVTLIQHDGGAPSWQVGTSHDIIWEYEGDVGPVGNNKVYISISRNTGGTWEKLNGGVGIDVANNYNTTYSNQCFWTWDPVPAPESTQAMIRIESAAYPSDIDDESAAVFTIEQVVTITKPELNDVWRYGTQRDIEWTLKGSTTDDKVKVFYKKGAGGYAEIAPGVDKPSTDLKYAWTIPNDLDNEVYVKVQDYSLTNIYHESPAFKIKGSIVVTAPTTNFVKISDTSETTAITWDVNGSITGWAKIMLSKNSGSNYTYELTTPDTTDITAGTFNWTVLPVHEGANDMIMVALQGDEDLVTGTAGESNTGTADFAVKPQIKLSYPDATGIVKTIGETMDIRWKPVDFDFGDVMIAYSTNGGTDYDDLLGGSIPSENNYDTTYEDESYYTWTIENLPGIVSQQCKIKVYSVKVGDEDDVSDASLNNFAILG